MLEGDATTMHSTSRSADDFNFNVRHSQALLDQTSQNESELTLVSLIAWIRTVPYHPPLNILLKISYLLQMISHLISSVMAISLVDVVRSSMCFMCLV